MGDRLGTAARDGVRIGDPVAVDEGVRHPRHRAGARARTVTAPVGFEQR
ncbi:hypothetical protein PWG71_23160 [Nocardiopsis sp. N85]|nr:hypothetical protein [Nocardiopsis sp. N85]MDE3724301.1 hypothetical protein [Nocardiopsis sp. N85]